MEGNMELYKAIHKRRTIRRFKAPATEEQLKRIIKMGTLAPSPRNTQTWEFIVLDDPEYIEEISEIKYVLSRDNKSRGEAVAPEIEESAQAQKDSFANASLVMVFHADEPVHGAGAWCCIQNMLLSAVAEGLGGKISYFRGDSVDQIKAILNVPEGMDLAAAVSIGIPDQEPAPRNLRREGEWLHRNRFRQPGES
jgi:nitroreductase